MADNPGKYDENAQRLLASLGATGLFMMVIGNALQTGMSFVAADLDSYTVIRAQLPSLLRQVADEIEKQNRPVIEIARN